MADSNKDYRPSWIVDLIHSFPHFDLSFQAVNSTFNWADQSYKEVCFKFLTRSSVYAHTSVTVSWDTGQLDTRSTLFK